MGYLEEMSKRLKELEEQKEELESKLAPVVKEYHSILAFMEEMDFKPEDSEQSKESNEPEEYPSDKNLNEKIKFILNIKKRATSNEIINLLHAYKDEVSKSYVAVTLSGMARSKEIQVVGKNGRASIYSL